MEALDQVVHVITLQEALHLLDKGLPIPAYHHLLKLSHSFNVLDARGAVGLTERANCFATMRGLAQRVAALWLAKREKLGYPIECRQPPRSAPLVDAATTGAQTHADFLLEVGVEELPPADALSACQQLRHSPLPLGGGKRGSAF